MGVGQEVRPDTREGVWNKGRVSRGRVTGAKRTYQLVDHGDDTLEVILGKERESVGLGGVDLQTRVKIESRVSK